MERVSRDLERAGVLHRVNYRVMCERLAGDGPVAPVTTFADVAQAVTLGVRARAHQYRTDEPLNRLADTVLPESDLARHFAGLVATVKDPVAAAQLRQWLVLWRDNDARLQPVIAHSILLAGTEPASQTLADVAKIGLEALEAIESGKHLNSDWAARTKARLATAARPIAEVRIAIVPGVQMLADMASR